jgi:hypothetical protein
VCHSLACQSRSLSFAKRSSHSSREDRSSLSLWDQQQLPGCLASFQIAMSSLNLTQWINMFKAQFELLGRDHAKQRIGAVFQSLRVAT